MKINPVANILPNMDDEEFNNLVKDIKKHGVREAIWLDRDGAIIDGRHRYRACEQLGIQCPTRIFEGTDLVGFVASLNITRRHLTKGQLALAAARARTWYDEQAKERQKLSDGRGKKGVETLPHLIEEPTKARDLAGKAFGVSGKYVDYATKVIDNATPELIAAVEKGTMSITTAAILATEPEEVQKAEVSNPRRNRTYHSVTKAKDEESEHVEQEINEPIKAKGIGVERANEAINILQTIPRNDGLRKRGLALVTDWCKFNQ